MKLSVVVPVHNGGAHLRACLTALAQSTRRPDEIIVVDDGSSDGAVAGVAELATSVVSLAGGPHGPAYARNRGAARATGDLLVFVDADVEVHRDAVERFERLFAEDRELAAAFGSYDDRPLAPGSVSRFKNLLHHYVHQHGRREADTFWAGCGAIRRAAFAAVEGFAEQYRRPSIEDIELGTRLRQAGFRIRLCPEIFCTHRKRWTFRSLVRTDIASRAIPWTRLILRQGRLPSGLNTDARSRWSALLAGVLVLGLLAAPSAVLARAGMLALAAAVVSLAAAGALWGLNRQLYGFFFGHGGRRFGLCAMVLHVLYLLYSSGVFATLLVAERLTGGTAEVNTGQARPGGLSLPSPRRKHVTGAIVCGALFAIYVGNGDSLPGNDATPNVHLAANLLAHGRLSYTPEDAPGLFVWTIAQKGISQRRSFRSWDAQLAGIPLRELYRQGKVIQPEPAYYLARTTTPGVYVSSYGPAAGLFALPFVAAAYPFVKNLPARTDLLWLLCKLAASFGVAASAWFLFLVASEHLRLATAVALTSLYGLGTGVWSVSSQALWQHAPGQLFLALGMFALFRATRTEQPVQIGAQPWSRAIFADGYAYLAGSAFALAFMCRPTNSLAVLAGFLVLLGQRRSLLRYVIAGLPIAALFVAYNLRFHGKLVAFGQVAALAERVHAASSAELWRHSLLEGLAGVLISPSRGVFVYSPILLVAVWGASSIWKPRRWLPLRAALLGALGIWLVTARWGGWWGGWSFGYRLVTDSATLLAFLAIPVAERIRARRRLLVPVMLLGLWSVGAQALGVFVYDVTGWNNREGFTTYRSDGAKIGEYFVTSAEAASFCERLRCSYGPAHMNVDRFRARLWSIRDSQLVYYLQNLKRSRQNRAASMRQFLKESG